MSVSIYNTLTRSKQSFTTLKPGKVTMYCCGVTVYDDCHLGHARSYIGWDVVRRYLQWRGYQVQGKRTRFVTKESCVFRSMLK